MVVMRREVGQTPGESAVFYNQLDAQPRWSCGANEMEHSTVESNYRPNVASPVCLVLSIPHLFFFNFVSLAGVSLAGEWETEVPHVTSAP